MNYYEAKKYLGKAYTARQRINSKRERLERWKEESVQTSAQMQSSLVSGSPDKQQTEKNIIAIVDLEREIQKDISELANLEREIQKEINLIDDDLQKTVLELRYLNFMKWDSICAKLNYSSRQIFNLHKSGILSFMKNHKD